jgi:CxxC-x17-CxxC domain-containing protein
MAYAKPGKSKFIRSRPEARGRFGDRDSRSDSGRDSRPSAGRFDRPRSNLTLFDVTCESCGKDTQVPFKPTGGKPVYCRDCFKSDAPRRDSPRDTSRSPDLSEINEKLDKIMAALKIR